MENRKTAETLQEKILYVIQSNYNEYTGTNEAELHSSVDLAHVMQTFADQEKEVWSCEFLEWVDENYLRNDSGHWYEIHPINEHRYTTAQLYQIFKSERDGK